MPERRRRPKSKIDVDLVIEGGDWPDPDELETLIQVAAAEVAAERRFELGKASVAIALANDDQVAILNGQFRAKSKPTNVCPRVIPVTAKLARMIEGTSESNPSKLLLLVSA